MPKIIKTSLAVILIIASQAQMPGLAHSGGTAQRHCHHDGAKGYVHSR